MEIRSAVAGAFATVAVAGLVFTAVAVSNAQEPAPVAPVTVTVVGHYSTIESQDPIEYVPEPVAVPEPVVEAPPADIPVEVPVIDPAAPPQTNGPNDPPPGNIDLGPPPVFDPGPPPSDW